MKEWLSLTRIVEILSIFTGVGVVISATLYSMLFGFFNLNYLAVASLSDILRDSLKLLILFGCGSLMAFPLQGVFALIFYQKSLWLRVLTAAVISFAGLITVVMVASILVSLTGTNQGEDIYNLPIGALAVLFFFSWICILFIMQISPIIMLNGKITLSLSDEKQRNKVRILIALITAISIFIVSKMIVYQMENGLPMVVDLGDVKGCKGQGYTAVWLGDGKAVVKCDKSGLYVVKAL